jgi:hypothetical protein
MGYYKCELRVEFNLMKSMSYKHVCYKQREFIRFLKIFPLVEIDLTSLLIRLVRK